MPDLVAGAEILAADYPVVRQIWDSTDIAGISTTTYTAGTPVADFTFQSPTSGRVLLIVSAQASADVGDRVFVVPEVYEGSDTSETQVVHSNAPLRGVITDPDSAASMCWSRITLLDGLTPAITHYARVMHRVDGGSNGGVFDRTLSIIPVP